jgi:hypothetical protein
MDNYHLVKDGDEWKLRRENSQRASLTFDNKQEGVSQSAEYMRQHGGSLKIHLENGRIQEERTYPRKVDPPESKG